ncbi:MAG: hypothetical protein AAF224_04320 [Pseudomonadota bacterium]
MTLVDGLSWLNAHEHILGSVRLAGGVYLLAYGLFVLAQDASPRAFVRSGLSIAAACVAAPIGPFIAVATITSLTALSWRGGFRNLQGRFVVLWTPALFLFIAEIYLRWLFQTDAFFLHALNASRTTSDIPPIIFAAAAPLAMAPLLEKEGLRRIDITATALVMGGAAAFYALWAPASVIILVMTSIALARAVTSSAPFTIASLTLLCGAGTAYLTTATEMAL